MSDTYSGFKCWTSQENNTWDSHDPTGKGGLGKNKNNEYVLVSHLIGDFRY